MWETKKGSRDGGNQEADLGWTGRVGGKITNSTQARSGGERTQPRAFRGFWELGFELQKQQERPKKARAAGQGANQSPLLTMTLRKEGGWAQRRDRGREEAPLCREMQNAKLTEAGCDG